MRPPPPHNLVNRIVAVALCLLVFSGTLGLGAVWVRQEIFSAANRNHAIEKQIADVERRLDEVNAGVAIALNPQVLLQRNESMRLGLGQPREIQVRRPSGSPELRLAAKRNREIFSIASAGYNLPARGASRFTLAANR